MSRDTETPSNFLANLQDVLFQVGQIVDLRLALLIGLLAFFVVVGFDSSGNRAEAADLLRQGQMVPAVSVAQPSIAIVETNVSGQAADNAVPGVQRAGSDIRRLATAKRLRHGTLTGAVMTSSRLTQAHFFTDLPSSR